ncbi:MAG: preprotein translocase subunit YajC [Candidatus Marinimicrobia bacterium]|nr:preprotein translocase subunit YajC [Candidatus Neomarinimicrobiota bacterium]
MNFIQLFAGGQGAQGGGGFLTFLPMVIILVIIYLLMIRPQAKRQKDKQKMLEDLKKGNHIVTIGGIHGTIAGFKGKEKKSIILKVDKNTNMTINRSAIAGQVDSVEDSDTEMIETQN